MQITNLKVRSIIKASFHIPGSRMRDWGCSWRWGILLWEPRLQSWLWVHSRWTRTPASSQQVGHKRWCKFCEHKERRVESWERSFCIITAAEYRVLFCACKPRRTLIQWKGSPGLCSCVGSSMCSAWAGEGWTGLAGSIWTPWLRGNRRRTPFVLCFFFSFNTFNTLKAVSIL